MRNEAENAETEIKFRVTDAQLARLARSDWWRSLEAGAPAELRSVYYDTPASDLRRRGLSLRIRNKGAAFEQTLKMAAGDRRLSRGEWTTPMQARMPDAGAVSRIDLPAAVKPPALSDLAPVVRVAVKRETRTLFGEGSEIEFALDDGVIEAGALVVPVKEIELELIAGKPRALIAAARRLLDVAGGRAHLQSKADRGFNLADGRVASWSKPRKFLLDAEMDAAEALQAIVLQCFEHLTSNDDCARASAHIEGVHQCRIACRQIRSAFRVYRPLLPDEPFGGLSDEARRIARALARARDLDVMEAELLEPAKVAVDAADTIDTLLAALAAQRRKAYGRVSSALGDRRYEKFLIDLLAVSATGGWVRKGDRKRLRKPAARFAGKALDKAYRRVRKSGRGVAGLAAADLHRLRIDMKRMRYAADFFASLFGPEQSRPFRKQLAGLQDRLGELNDVAVARKSLDALVARAAEGDPARLARLSSGADLILQWRREGAALSRQALADEWASFEAAEPFWK